MRRGRAAARGPTLRSLPVAAALLIAGLGAAEEEPAPKGKEAAPAGSARKEANPKAERPKEAGKAAKPKKARAKKPPATVKLPPAGEHEAEEILALAGVLSGRPVRIESDRMRTTKVEISEALGDVDVTLDELTVLLAAYRLYLFPITDPREGEILVVSRNPTWSEEPEVFTRILEVPAASFAAAEERIRKAVEDRNAALPAASPRFVAVASARAGKIFIRGPREGDLEAIAKLVETAGKDAAREEARRPRLYTYQGRFRMVEVLEEELLEELEEGERNMLRTVVSSRGNRLLYRCPAALGEKVKAILEKLDKKKEVKK